MRVCGGFATRRCRYVSTPATDHLERVLEWRRVPLEIAPAGGITLDRNDPRVAARRKRDREEPDACIEIKNGSGGDGVEHRADQ